jgi:hypothetical protein
VKISTKSSSKITNQFFRAASIVLFLFYLQQITKSSIYEVLFIDERMLIDDIYNVWLMEDIYGRFLSIQNQTIKNILVVFIELAYGGDLRYGRLWYNLFIILAGPATFISDTAVIVFSRFINASIFFLGSYFISKFVVGKKHLWTSVFLIYSLPAVEYFLRVPKPDALVMLFAAFGFKYLLKKNYYLAIFLFAIASFIKITAFFLFVFVWIYMFLNSGNNRLSFTIKSGLTSLLSMFVVNPILLIPPLTFGSIELPNFFKIYVNWLTTQGSNGDEISISFSNISLWFQELSIFYKVNNNIIFSIAFVALVLAIASQILKSSDELSNYLLLTFIFFILFYFLLIERAWTHYLHLPFTLLVIAYLRTLKSKNLSLIVMFFIISIGTVGNYSNMDRYLNDKTFNMNTRLNYESVSTENDAKKLIDNIISEISTIYSKNSHLTKNLVYWHPDLITPRNKVTYSDKFYVREYWGDKNEVNFALQEADFFVTYTNYPLQNNIIKKKIENFYIYYKNK